jgi:hypothetical protein
MALTLIENPALTLEDLDQFGSLDGLPFSLDDIFWMARAIYLQGSSGSPTGAAALGHKVFFGGPHRSVSPGGIYTRGSWTTWFNAPLVSISPGGARFGFGLILPGALRSVSPASAALGRPYMNITPLKLPLRLFSPGRARISPRLKGHGWITRAV